MSKLFILQNFEIHRIIKDLEVTGATSVQLLTEYFRLVLLQEAQNYSYTPEPEVVGTGNQVVRQKFGLFADFPAFTHYSRLKDAFQILINEHLAAFKTYPFASKLDFNSMMLQKYDLGSIGITPHRDSLSYINLVCLFNIDGSGRFYVCDDRSGSNAKVIDSSPGSVIFLRAPGFLNSPERPFHSFTDIHCTCYLFGLRQKSMPSQVPS